MNVKRFTARTSRDALALVRQAFGDDAVVMSTRPCADGVEVLAMAPESVQQLERVGASIPTIQAPRAPSAQAAPAAPAAAPAAPRRTLLHPTGRVDPQLDADSVEDDVQALQMSTLSFQEFVRERMLKRRRAEMAADVASAPVPPKPAAASIEAARTRQSPRAGSAAHREPPVLREELQDDPRPADPVLPRVAPSIPTMPAAAQPIVPAMGEAAVRGTGIAAGAEMMAELRSMRGLIEQRFGALAFMEKLQRQPRQAALSQRLLEVGLSPQLVRKLSDSLPAEGDEMTWAAGVLERNLLTGERDPALEDVGGVYALVGATGVGKTTSTAKLAAAFASKHGAANLGLITLDAYRVAAQEQLRTYGRILGVPVHTAHDRASLEDLLELLAGKKMVLIDTAGMAQRDTRTRELLDMLSHRAINRLLVVNAASQGETIEDVLSAYGANACRGVILSKLDEAVKLAPALDAMIRHRLKVLAVANGQRVPEDWHRLSANALMQRALRGGGSPAWRLDSADMNLVFAGMPAGGAGKALHA